MNQEWGSLLAECRPAVLADGDADFLPMILPYRKILALPGSPGAASVRIGVEREDGYLSVFETALREGVAHREAAYRIIERAVKFCLWSRGGWRVFFHGPPSLSRRLQSEYSEKGARAFDVSFMSRVFRMPFQWIWRDEKDFPLARESRRTIGGHFDGCRIGFDLGASDYKLAALIDGVPVYQDEIPWAPSEQPDPAYHYREIQGGLKKAASFLPRVDAIGGSSAGITINNRVRVASLFRAVPEELFEAQGSTIFQRLSAEWNVPFQVLNDGEVTALAGRLSFGSGAVLGIAMGSSEAVGYVHENGGIPGWLDELAFAPVDLSPQAPQDEWSGDRGVGASYFSQQAVARLAKTSGLLFPEGMRLPERLAAVQGLLEKGDERARRIFATIGVYLGYTLPWYECFYGFHRLIVLGRVMSGRAGEIIMTTARAVLEKEFPDTAARVELRLLDEKSRRVGQAVAAASLPEIVEKRRKDHEIP